MQPRTGPTLRIAFLTVGDLSRRTGGYLYHAQVHDLLRAHGDDVREIVLTSDPGWDAQRAFDPASIDAEVACADVLLIDALACRAVLTALPQWHARQVVVAMVHELPTVADPQLAEQQDLLAAEAALLQHADHVITVSAFNAALLHERGVAPERLSIAAPGSDRLTADDLSADPAATNGMSTPFDDGIHVLCLAQWIPRKGIDVLVRAWQQACAAADDDCDTATLHLVGERTADADYTTQIDALIGNDHTIVVHGVLSDNDLAELWQHVDLFVLPSRAEGYGMVYAEALLRGVPVIATATGPIPELVDDGGELVPVDDVDALANTLRRLLDDPAARIDLSDHAAQRGRQLPRWSDTAAAVANAIATAKLFRNPADP